MNVRRLAGPAAVAIAAASVAAVAALHLAALQLLADGPDLAGYDLLVVADRAAVADAVLLSGVGVLLAALHRTRAVAAVLLVGFAASWAVVAALESLGRVLANVQPTQQPQALSTMFSAMTGTSAALTPVPCILLTGAVLTLLVARLPRPGRSRAVLVG